jgi:predicted kinase
MTELVITRGLPASGKTTFARKWVDEDRQRRARVNRDDLRQMLDEGTFVKGVTEQRVMAARNAIVDGLLRRGVSVVVDDTNLPNRTCRDLHDIAGRAKAEFRIEDFTHVSLETCLARNTVREDKAPIPQHVIQDMYLRHLHGRTYPLPFYPTERSHGQALDLYVPDVSLPLAFICDIDGTVALAGARDPFDETTVHLDRPNPIVIEQVNEKIALGYQPIFLSGRTQGCYDATLKWLGEHIHYDEPGCVNDYGNVEKPFKLLMRPVGDNRKDAIVKRELFDLYVRHHYNVRVVYDDRNQVVNMWRNELGLTCLQVAPGDF